MVQAISRHELFSRLAEGHAARVTVVTPNRRLAQSLMAEFDAHQAARGLPAWEAPDVLPLDAFVARLWEDALYSGQDLPLLLTAAQVLCTLKAWESDDYCFERLKRPEALGSIDRAKLNPKGSSVAIGHPFAATGARILATLAKQLAARGSGRGLISICAAGGMGVTAILER